LALHAQLGLISDFCNQQDLFANKWVAIGSMGRGFRQHTPVQDDVIPRTHEVLDDPQEPAPFQVVSQSSFERNRKKTKKVPSFFTNVA
jgi:hypothetical protein